VRSLHILSTIIVICLSVKMGFDVVEEAEEEDEVATAVSLEGPAADMAADAALMTDASSIIGSGEDGGDDLSPVVAGAICFLLRSLLSSSLRLLAISAGERGVSLNTEADAAEEVEGDGDIIGDREFCCRLSMASYRSRPCSLRGTHLRLLEGGGLWFGTGPSCPGTTPTGPTGEAGSKGCSDSAA